MIKKALSLVAGTWFFFTEMESDTELLIVYLINILYNFYSMNIDGFETSVISEQQEFLKYIQKFVVLSNVESVFFTKWIDDECIKEFA